MENEDMAERILARFENKLIESGDISSQTKKVLSHARDSSNFGDDERLLEALVADEDK